jgi:hypothetical protein
LIPVYFSPYSPANAGSVTINETGAVTHNIIAGVGVASFTMNVPTLNSGSTGAIAIVTISNTSGGALAVTWNAAFKMAAWTNPANGFNRTISFYYNGTNWMEMSAPRSMSRTEGSPGAGPDSRRGRWPPSAVS